MTLSCHGHDQCCHACHADISTNRQKSGRVRLNHPLNNYHFVRVEKEKKKCMAGNMIWFDPALSGDNRNEKRMINVGVCAPIEHDIQIGSYSESRNLN